MDLRDRLIRLIDLLYAAPGSDEGWSSFLLALCDDLNGSAASFLSHDVANRKASVLTTAKASPEAIREYFERWDKSDPWVYSPALPRQSGAIVVGEQLIGDREFRCTPYYNEFARKFELTRCLGGLIEVGDRVFSTLSVNASDSRAPFDESDRRLLELLMPHLERALQLHRRVAGTQALADASLDALDRLDRGVIVVDGRADVVHANNVAAEVLAARDGLTVENSQLRAATLADTIKLRDAIAAATATAQGRALQSGGRFALSRRSGQPPLRVVVAPLVRAPSPLTPHSVWAIVFLTDPARINLPPDDLLRQLFSLTQAEAKLVRALTGGCSVAEAALKLGVTVATARQRLKIVFEKTGTHRQAELIRHVMTTTGAF
jgi:DNA-binding CsgD family transcriptional regulator